MSEQPCIRVLIADDHDMVRNGLSVLIGGFEGLKLVGQAANGEEAVRLCATAQPDVVLMDLKMPEMDGVTAIGVIHKAQPDVTLIALTSFHDEWLAEAALKAGATSCLLKNVSVDELADAIRQVG